MVEDQIVFAELLRRWNRGRWIRRGQGIGATASHQLHVIILGVFMLPFGPRREYQKKHGQVLLELTTLE